MSVINILLIITFFASLCLGLWVILRNKRNLSFVFLALSLVSASLWALFIFLTIETINSWCGMLSFTFAALIFLFFNLFLLAFSNRLTKTYSTILSLISGLAVASTLIPGLLVEKTLVTNGYLEIATYGKLYPVFLAYVVLYSVLMIISSAIGAKKLSGDKKLRLQYIITGIFLGVVFGVTFNLILPTLGIYKLNNLGPVFLLITSAFTIYSTTRHYQYEPKVMLSELYAVCLLLISIIRMAIDQSPFSLILSFAVILICFFFIRTVISEAEQKIKLNQDKLDLQKLDHMKDEFLMIATHELNTPITVIQSKLSMMIDEGMGGFSGSQIKILEPVYADSRKLSSLVRKLVETISIDQNKFMIKWEDFDLIPLVEEEISKIDKKEGPSFDINLEKPKGLLLIKADKRSLAEVLENLLSNAVKFSKLKNNNGKIEVTISAKSDGVSVSVKDNGVGISKENLKHIGEKFFQAERFDADAPVERSGAGLGLYISKKIIDLHGGELTFSSEYGEGVVFTIFLPKK